MILGCIGDDFTGASDLANTLARQGMRTLQFSGVPVRSAPTFCEAGVIALKSRTIAPQDAINLSLAALEWLLGQGARQIFFKYCSTFDSTRQGNIGPVAEALLDRLGAPGAVACPALPANGRTIYQGHLFVGDRLLSESGMENHPLTPMRDPDLRRWLAYQTRTATGLVNLSTVAKGPTAIRAALDACYRRRERLVIVDATSDDDLRRIGTAVSHDLLVTGGSGIALGLPENFRKAGLLGAPVRPWFGVEGAAVILSGSCSSATRAQVATYAARHPSLLIEADALMSAEIDVDKAYVFCRGQTVTPLIYSSAEPHIVAAGQAKWGREALAGRFEAFFAALAQRLTADGFRRLVVAGGETSGAVATALGRPCLEIGPEIDPGVPALQAVGEPSLALALKSGNFGGPDFFEKALRVLAGGL
jgi:uncharacterized protein YgbK (DUF1537 family)